MMVVIGRDVVMVVGRYGSGDNHSCTASRAQAWGLPLPLADLAARALESSAFSLMYQLRLLIDLEG
jgi:hypothetical protein